MEIQGWKGIEIVGMLADFVLYFFPGDILEIGVGTSSTFLTPLSEKYNRRIYHCDSNGEKILDLKQKGFFSERAELFICTSDEMFNKQKLSPLAFTFIDGYHGYEEAKRDFWNAEKLTIPNGFILLHDTYPPAENWVGINGGGSCGDVYKLRQELEQNKKFDCFTFVGEGNYIASTLIRKKPLNRHYYQE